MESTDQVHNPPHRMHPVHNLHPDMRSKQLN